MKASVILALPVLALAAATPPKVEERQLPNLPLDLPLDTKCLLDVANIDQCFPDLGSVTGNPFDLGDLVACIVSLPQTVGNVLFGAARRCIRLPLGLPIKE